MWKLTSEAQIDAATVERKPLWTDKRDDHGPFDIIGDVHGCARLIASGVFNPRSG